MSKPDILLIVLDTLRRDTLYSQIEKTVTFKKLVNDGVMYNNAISPASWTVPSHVSMFTGKYPSEHKIHGSRNASPSVICNDVKLPEKNLASTMKQLEYRTLSLLSNNLLGEGTVFSEGFEKCESIGPFHDMQSFMEPLIEKGILHNHLGGLQTIKKMIKSRDLRTGVDTLKVNSKILKNLKNTGYPSMKGASEIVDRYISQDKNVPSFTFMNLMEAHEPYTRPKFITFYHQGKDRRAALKELCLDKKIGKQSLKRARMMYSRSVKVLDRELGKLVKHLKDSGKYDNTLIVVTSDHGQALGEKGYFGHQIYLHDEIIRVPLIIKYPHSKKHVIHEGYQTLTDLFDFLTEHAKGNNVEFPSSVAVFSEAFGISHEELRAVTKGKCATHKEIVPRKAVFKGKYKLVVDVLNGKIEEFSSEGVSIHNGDNLQVLKEMMDELEIFIGNSDYKIPSLYPVTNKSSMHRMEKSHLENFSTAI